MMPKKSAIYISLVFASLLVSVAMAADPPVRKEELKSRPQNTLKAWPFAGQYRHHYRGFEPKPQYDHDTMEISVYQNTVEIHYDGVVNRNDQLFWYHVQIKGATVNENTLTFRMPPVALFPENPHQVETQQAGINENGQLFQCRLVGRQDLVCACTPAENCLEPAIKYTRKSGG